MSTTSAFSDSSDPIRISLDNDPGQLVAAVPHLMGFHPAESVVLIGHRPTEPSVIGWVLRADLPPEEFVAEQAAEMVARLALSDAFGLTLVVVGGSTDPTGSEEVPHRGLVEALRTESERRHLRVLHALWIPEVRADVHWRCYEESDCHGSVPDPGSSALAATLASSGRITFDSREDLAGLLTPDSAEDLARRSSGLDTTVDRMDACDCSVACSCGESGESTAAPRPGGYDGARMGFEDNCATVGRALVRLRAGALQLSDPEIVRIAVALSDVRVRDACLALALPPGSSAALTAESLWIALARATPCPERAEPAALLGYSAYLRGDGALADIALQTALRASPEHVLAGLLERALRKGVTPDQLAGLGRSETEVDLWQAGEHD